VQEKVGLIASISGKILRTKPENDQRLGHFCGFVRFARSVHPTRKSNRSTALDQTCLVQAGCEHQVTRRRRETQFAGKSASKVPNRARSLLAAVNAVTSAPGRSPAIEETHRGRHYNTWRRDTDCEGSCCGPAGFVVALNEGVGRTGLAVTPMAAPHLVVAFSLSRLAKGCLLLNWRPHCLR
jgi:hypothetical protein